MKPWTRWNSALIAAAVLLSASCSAEVGGAAAKDAADSAISGEEAPSTTNSDGSSPHDEEAPESSADSGAIADVIDAEQHAETPETADVPDTTDVIVDPATLEWMDAVCIDMMAMIGLAFGSPDADEASPEEYLIAHLDYYDAMAAAYSDMAAAAHERELPGVDRGAEVHDAYLDILNDLHAAALEGAVELERTHRTGDITDAAALVQGIEAELFELLGNDFTEAFADDVQLAAMMEAAQDAAPTCAELG